jgi:hypothetical protein
MLQRLWLANTFEGCALDFLNEGVDGSSPANTLIMRKSLIHNLLHDKGSSVQVIDIECLI